MAQGSAQGAPRNPQPCQALAQNVGAPPPPRCISGQQAPSTPGWQAGSQRLPTEHRALPALTSCWDNSSPGFFSRPPSAPATTLLFFILLIESFILLKGETLSGFMCQVQEGVFNDTSSGHSFRCRLIWMQLGGRAGWSPSLAVKLCSFYKQPRVKSRVTLASGCAQKYTQWLGA